MVEIPDGQIPYFVHVRKKDEGDWCNASLHATDGILPKLIAGSRFPLERRDAKV